ASRSWQFHRTWRSAAHCRHCKLMPAKLTGCLVAKALSPVGKPGKMTQCGGAEMNVSRRAVLRGAAALPLAVSNFGFGAAAQTASAADVPPILFVHGNGDHAALWITT